MIDQKGICLEDLKTGEEGIITRVAGHGAFRKRITEMGFVKGKKVKVIRNAPMHDPVEYEIMDYNVSLRRTEARMVEVISADMAGSPEDAVFHGTIHEEILMAQNNSSRSISVALVGNPNSGKTTLYNYASGSHERVGNYGGVTVDAHEAFMKRSACSFRIVDLPGTYSITEYTPEELYVRKYITESKPDVVINVIDASNLERNLYMTTQLIDMNIKVVIALNMYDELEKSGAVLQINEMEEVLGIPIVPTVASKGKGIDELFDRIMDIHENSKVHESRKHINYGPAVEKSIRNLQNLLEKNEKINEASSPRYLAVKLLEGDSAVRDMLREYGDFEKINTASQNEILKLEKEYREKSETVITNARYGFITGLLKENFIHPAKVEQDITEKIDKILTHRIFGLPIFLFFMWMMFQLTFSVGSLSMELIDSGAGWLGTAVRNSLSEGPLRDLLVDGIIGGVGGVIIFLPNILILFFFISFMEDTGYMARASFIMDKLMQMIGLHGKSFIPMLIGFGCNVPAIMATRTLENRKDRIITMMMIPFMSCSARLPVYVLLISAFFPKNQGLVLVSIYLIGILLSVVVAMTMSRTVFSRHQVPFIIELPPYRMPTLRNSVTHMWQKGVQYLKKMGTVILAASVIIWALGYFPRNVSYSRDYDSQIAILQSSDIPEMTKHEKINVLQLEKQSEHQERSYIGKLGHLVEPAIRPLGFDWKIGVSIITGLAAKEIVVSTMGILYQADNGSENSETVLATRLREQNHSSGELKGQKVFSPLVAYGLMLFVLTYFPCIAAIAAIRKESNIKWALFTMFYTTATAWIVAFITFQAGSLLF
jgi:ferrous iron transport protein B